MVKILSTKTTRKTLVALAVVALSWTLLASSTRPAHAATFTVTNTNDSGAGSLRQAIDDANNRTGADTINFNIPGDGPHTIAPTSSLPTITDPVTINGYSQPGSKPNSLAVGNNAVLKVMLTGIFARGSTGSTGLVIAASNSTVRGLVINSFVGSGIWIAGADSANNKIEGNYIGTDTSGAHDVGNLRGVSIVGAPTNTVGGTSPAARNVISGNDEEGVFIYDYAPGNKVMGNYIGTDRNGTADLGNSSDGVFTIAPGNTIGGTTAGARNVISGNDEAGVEIRSSDVTGSKVQGNFIGTDATGTQDLGNSIDGVFLDFIFGCIDVTIGGTVSGARNVISGNDNHGVSISNASTCKVQGNFIGTDKTGAADLGNTLDGVHIEGGIDNTIGGTTAGARNIISGNDDEGVSIISNTNLATGNRILSNSIFSNIELGIDLKGGTETADGVTANDDDDADTGPNNLQNYPEIASARPIVKRIRGERRPFTFIRGTLKSAPDTAFTLQLFSSPQGDPSGNGEGQRFLGQRVVTTDSAGDASFGVSVARGLAPVGSAVTATATDPDGNTSEFSAARTVQ